MEQRKIEEATKLIQQIIRESHAEIAGLILESIMKAQYSTIYIADNCEDICSTMEYVFERVERKLKE